MSTIIEMPKLSDTMTEGTLVKWLKKEGDPVESGDILAEVETDKATMELECFDDGIILKQYVGEGQAAPVGAAVCAIGEKGEAAPEVEAATAPEPAKEAPPSAPEPSTPAPAATVEAPVSNASPPPEPAPTSTGDARIIASPLAKKLAAEKGINLEQVSGSGPNGRIVKDDVLAYKPTSSPTRIASTAPAQAREDNIIKVNNMRGTIARRLLESKTSIPHFYLEMEVDVGALLKLRKELNDSLSKLSPEEGGIKLTVNDFILKATSAALLRVPAANASWQGDHIVQYGAINLAFAVSVEDGLVTPTINGAESKGIREIALSARELIDKARSKKLSPAEMSGSTFTITNLGMYGIRNFYGIINPPNGAILSIGATDKKPVVDANDNIVIGHRMSLGLSGDHRVVDGAVAAEFLKALKEIIECPALMLV